MPRGFEQFRYAGSCDGRDPEKGQLQRGAPLCQPVENRVAIVAQRVDLVRGHELRLRGELRLKEFQLTTDGIKVLHGIAAARTRRVDDMDQHARALEMAEELVAEPESPMGALNQARNVSNDKTAIVAQ